MKPGPPGSWDGEVTANPRIYQVNGQFINLYTGYSAHGTFWGIGKAISRDLMTWHPIRENPLIHSGERGSWNHANIDGVCLFRRFTGDWCLFYEGRKLFNTFTTQSFGFSTCPDHNLALWTPCPHNPVFCPTQQPGDFDAIGLLAPVIYRISSKYWMFYSGFDGEKMRTGLAFSSDLLEWNRYTGNPILDTGPPGSWDSHGAILINLFQVDGIFFGFYEGMDIDGFLAVGLACSTDLLHWEKVSIDPVLTNGESGCFDEKKVCSPYNWIHNGRLYVFYGAHPVGERPGYTGLATGELAEWARNARTCVDEISLSKS